MSHSTLRILVVILLVAVSAAAQLRPRTSGDKSVRPRHDARMHESHVVFVKFVEGLTIRAADGALTDRGTGALETALGLQELTGTWKPAHRLNEADLDRLRDNAQRRLGREIADLNLWLHYFLGGGETPSGVLAAINALDLVEIALPAPKPAELPTPPDFSGNQGYQAAAPAGLGSMPTWQFPGGRGAGVQVVDLEYSFNDQHVDLPAVTQLGPTPINPFPPDDHHGTAVLGIMGAKDDGVGITGMASDATYYFRGTYSGMPPVWDVGAAITDSLAVLGAGDVIVIEQQMTGPATFQANTCSFGQFGLVPVEWWQPWYDAIVTAVGNGVTVCEAAGNGMQDLDDPLFTIGNGGHYPFLPQNDSGAMIIGAGASPGGSDVDRSRLCYSNWGSTVDLQFWGENVWATGYGESFDANGLDEFYTDSFGGTSSATALAGGAVAMLQGAYNGETGGHLTPEQVKIFLRDYGYLQQSGTAPASQHIGPRPDVLLALTFALAVSPPQVFGGDEQMALIGETFAAPIVVQVANGITGAPLAGETVTFMVTGGSATLGTPTAVTDGNGFAQTLVTPTANAGQTITIEAVTSTGSTTFSLYTRGINVIYLPTGTLIVQCYDAPNGASSVPYVLMSGTSQPVTPTPFGDLCLNPAHPNTAVFCDGVGLFNFFTVQGETCIGTPNMINVYTGAVGLGGLGVMIQGFAYNPGNSALGWWVTNCRTIP